MSPLGSLLIPTSLVAIGKWLLIRARSAWLPNASALCCFPVSVNRLTELLSSRSNALGSRSDIWGKSRVYWVWPKDIYGGSALYRTGDVELVWLCLRQLAQIATRNWPRWNTILDSWDSHYHQTPDYLTPNILALSLLVSICLISQMSLCCRFSFRREPSVDLPSH